MSAEQEPTLLDSAIKNTARDIAWLAWPMKIGPELMEKLRALVLIAQSEANIRADAERERCARIAEAWADSHDRWAMIKQDDAPASAMSHTESAIIGRSIAAAIREEQKPARECSCHSGSVCSTACAARHHDGCGARS